jgi:hypothetical protein
MVQDHDFPWAVDIPIPPAGLGPLLPVLLDAVQACGSEAMLTTIGMPPAAEVRCWYNRILTRHRVDARRLARTFSSIGAREVDHAA